MLLSLGCSFLCQEKNVHVDLNIHVIPNEFTNQLLNNEVLRCTFVLNQILIIISNIWRQYVIFL